MMGKSSPNPHQRPRDDYTNRSVMKISAAVSQLEPSATIAAAAKARALKSQGIKVYDFTLGEPDFTTPAHICDAAKKAMADGHTHYTPSGGIPELKQAVCKAYQRDYGLNFEPDFDAPL